MVLLRPLMSSKLLQQDLSAACTLHLSVDMNGFVDAGDVEDQLIRFARHRLHEIGLRHTVQAEHNVLQPRDRSRAGNKAKTVLFRGVDLGGQVKREGMVAPAAGEVGGPNLRRVIPVAGRGCRVLKTARVRKIGVPTLCVVTTRSASTAIGPTG